MSAVTAATVTRLSVLASADDGDLALREAQRRSRDGDESWAEWVARLRDGRALIVRLRTRIEYRRACPGLASPSALAAAG